MKKWWKSIKSGLNKSSSALTQSISAIFQQKKISCESWKRLKKPLFWRIWALLQRKN